MVFCTVCKISCILTFPHTNACVTKFYLGIKIGQAYPRVNIWTHYDGPESPRLHTKFHGTRPSGFGEEDFLRYFLYIWAWLQSWSCDLDLMNKLSFPNTMEVPIFIRTWICRPFVFALARVYTLSADQKGSFCFFSLWKLPSEIEIKVDIAIKFQIQLFSMRWVGFDIWLYQFLIVAMFKRVF